MIQTKLDSNADSIRRIHDLGGLPDETKIEQREKPKTMFDRRVDALMVLLTHPSRAVFTVDALRRVIEQLSPDDYRDFTYYQKWCHAICTLLLEQEVISQAEFANRIATFQATEAGSDAVGNA